LHVHSSVGITAKADIETYECWIDERVAIEKAAWLYLSDQCRPIESTTPPAANGTIILMGRLG
jgi:hypothetical protein